MRRALVETPAAAASASIFFTVAVVISLASGWLCSLLDYERIIPQARYIVNTLAPLFSPAAKK
jgi:hypothetical protein